ncbi:hypothetical protein C8Q76DRAFT_608362 [Earliella scabrosa]|nr:hypothetical protein C8Q76DRAFT_608362 [Earliella scabrosa]
MYYKALRNPETVSNIASYVYWGRNMPDTPLDLRGILALALTCKAFLEPALDQLWRRQLNLVNLIKTLPKDSWELCNGDFVGPDGQRLQLIRNIRVIIPSDWPRFNYYAAKIRELGYDPRSPFGAPQSLQRWRATGVPMYMLMALCAVRLPYELLPNIKHLRCTTHEYTEDTYIHMYIFLNAPLVSLKLDFSVRLPPPFRDDVFIEYTLKAIIEQCPNCRDIEIVTPQMEYYQEALKPFLHSERALSMRTFSTNMHAWTEDDLVRLASLRALRKTQVYVSDADCGWMSRAIEALSPHRPFASVVDLTLGGAELECCTAFFILWGTCWLERLRIECERRPDVDVLRTFAATLAASCSTNTLRVLEIADSAPPPPLPSPVTDSHLPSDPTPNAVLACGDALLPLTEFRSLRSFVLDLSDMRGLDDGALASLVSAWPYLETLYLGRARGWGGHRSMLTFAGLGAVVQACPRLEGLAISIDATPAVALDEVRSEVKLETVDLLDSYAGELEAAPGLEEQAQEQVWAMAGVGIARNLVKLFPELVRVKAWTRPVQLVAEADPDVEMETEVEIAVDGLPEWLVPAGFWETVEKQVATLALLRDVDMDMVGL